MALVEAEREITEVLFRDVMAAVCSPVTVVTTFSGEKPVGATVSAFTSLSLRPAMIVIALNCGSGLHRSIAASGTFGMNVLAHDQTDLALAFARKDSEKFEGIAWTSEHGLPRLSAVVAWLACDLHRLVDGGDHVLLLGSVVAAEVCGRASLVYVQRTFGTPRLFGNRTT
jgi:flavin reductase (DIM6/NTAB) family NADH-FMN oxidoreductase RutF